MATYIHGDTRPEESDLPNASNELGVKAHRAAVRVLNTQIDLVQLSLHGSRIERAVTRLPTAALHIKVVEFVVRPYAEPSAELGLSTLGDETL